MHADDKKLHEENTLASIWRPPLDYVFSIVLLAVIYITWTIIWTQRLPLQTFHGSWQAASNDHMCLRQSPLHAV